MSVVVNSTTESASSDDISLTYTGPNDKTVLFQQLKQLTDMLVKEPTRQDQLLVESIEFKLHQQNRQGETHSTDITCNRIHHIPHDLDEAVLAVFRLSTHKGFKRCYIGICIDVLKRLLGTSGSHLQGGGAKTATLAFHGMYCDSYRVDFFETAVSAIDLEGACIRHDKEEHGGDCFRNGTGATAVSTRVYVISCNVKSWEEQNRYMSGYAGSRDEILCNAQAHNDRCVASTIPLTQPGCAEKERLSWRGPPSFARAPWLGRLGGSACVS